MTSIQRSVARAKRRVVLASLVRWTGWAALLALGAACVMRVVDQLLPLVALPLWAYFVPAGLALIGAFALALRAMPGDAEAAVLLDDKLKLKDKLATAMYTATLPEQTDLTRQVAREGDEAAQRARTMVAQAVPVRFTKVWNAVPVVMGLVVAAVFVPEADPLKQVERQQEKEEEARLAEHTEEIIINTTQNLPDGEDTPDTEFVEGEPDEARGRLEAIAEEIRANPEKADELRREAAALASQEESRLEQQSDIVEATFRPLENSNSQLDSGVDGPANDFESAMRRNDFESAQEAVQEMQEQIERNEEMTQEEREQAQQQLENLSQQLQQHAQNHQQQQQNQQQQAQQNLQQQLQQSGMSASQAQQTAQQMTQQMQQAMQPQNQPAAHVEAVVPPVAQNVPASRSTPQNTLSGISRTLRC